jgi:hypothetical protein
MVVVFLATPETILSWHRAFIGVHSLRFGLLACHAPHWPAEVLLQKAVSS